MPLVEHRNVSGHAEQIGSGEIIGPEQVGKLDPKAQEDGALTAAALHDAALIASEAFVPLKEQKQQKGDE